MRQRVRWGPFKPVLVTVHIKQKATQEEQLYLFTESEYEYRTEFLTGSR